MHTVQACVNLISSSQQIIDGYHLNKNKNKHLAVCETSCTKMCVKCYKGTTQQPLLRYSWVECPGFVHFVSDPTLYGGA